MKNGTVMDMGTSGKLHAWLTYAGVPPMNVPAAVDWKIEPFAHVDGAKDRPGFCKAPFWAVALSLGCSPAKAAFCKQEGGLLPTQANDCQTTWQFLDLG